MKTGDAGFLLSVVVPHVTLVLRRDGLDSHRSGTSHSKRAVKSHEMSHEKSHESVTEK